MEKNSYFRFFPFLLSSASFSQFSFRLHSPFLRTILCAHCLHHRFDSLNIPKERGRNFVSKPNKVETDPICCRLQCIMYYDATAHCTVLKGWSEFNENQHLLSSFEKPKLVNLVKTVCSHRICNPCARCNLILSCDILLSHASASMPARLHRPPRWMNRRMKIDERNDERCQWDMRIRWERDEQR